MVEVVTVITALNEISVLVKNYHGYSTNKFRKSDDDNIRSAFSLRLRSIKNIAQSGFDDSVKSKKTDLANVFEKLTRGSTHVTQNYSSSISSFHLRNFSTNVKTLRHTHPFPGTPWPRPSWKGMAVPSDTERLKPFWKD